MKQDDTLEVGRAGIVFIVGSLFSMGAGFVLRVYLARQLSVPDFGVVFVFLSTLNILSIPCLLGLNQGVTKFVSAGDRSEDNKDAYATIGLIIVLSVSLIAIFLIFISENIIRPYFPSEIREETVFMLLLFCLPLYNANNIVRNILRGRLDTTRFVILTKMIKPGSQLLFVIALTTITATAIGAVSGLVVSILLVTLLGWKFLHSSGWSPKTVSEIDIWPLLRFSLPLMISSSVYILLSHFDKIALAYFISSGVVGKYEIIVTLASLLTLFHSGFSFLLFPKISELTGKGETEQIQKMYHQSTKWILGSTVPLYAVIVFRPEPFMAVFGGEFTAVELSLPLTVFAAGMVVDAVVGPNGEALLGFGRSRAVLVYNVIAVVTNLILNIALIPQFGLLGAAAASFVGYLLMNFLKSIDLYFVHSISVMHPKSIIMAIGCILVGGSVGLLTPTGDTLVGQLASAGLLGTSSILSGLLTLVVIGGITDDDRKLVRQLHSMLGVSR